MRCVLLAALLLARIGSQSLPAEQWRALLPNATTTLFSPASPLLSSPGGGAVYVAYTARVKPRTPSVLDDVVPAVAAFDTASGRLRWSFRFSFDTEHWARGAGNAVIYLTLAANGSALIVFSETDFASCLAVLNATSGVPTFPPSLLGGSPYSSAQRPFALPALTAAGDLALINLTSANGSGRVFTIPIIDVRSGAARATAVLPASDVRAAGLDATRTRIVVYTETLSSAGFSGTFYAYSAVTGAQQWAHTLPAGQLLYNAYKTLCLRAGSLYALVQCTDYQACPRVFSLSLTDGRLQTLQRAVSSAEGLYSVPAGLLVTLRSRSQQWGLALLDATSLVQRWQWVQNSPSLGFAPLITADGAWAAVGSTCYTSSAASACSGTSASVVGLASGAETPVQFNTQYARPVALPSPGRPAVVWAVGSAHLNTGGLARSAEADVVWQTRTDKRLVYLGTAVNYSSSLVLMLDTEASALVAATAPEAGPAAGAASSTSATLSAGAQAGIALAAVAACGAALAAALHLRKLRARLAFRELPEGAAKGSGDATLSVGD